MTWSRMLAVCDTAGVESAVFMGASGGSSLAAGALDDGARFKAGIGRRQCGVAASGLPVAGYESDGIAYRAEHIHQLVTPVSGIPGVVGS